MRFCNSVRLFTLALICSLAILTSCARKETEPKPAAEKAAVKVAWDKVVGVCQDVADLAGGGDADVTARLEDS